MDCQGQDSFDGRSATLLEVLHRSLMLRGRSAGLERAQVPPLAGARILLPGVEPILTAGQFPNHPDTPFPITVVHSRTRQRVTRPCFT
jgi:hypothetical protein